MGNVLKKDPPKKPSCSQQYKNGSQSSLGKVEEHSGRGGIGAGKSWSGRELRLTRELIELDGG